MIRAADILQSASPEDAADRVRSLPPEECARLVDELADEVLRQLRVDARRAHEVAQLTAAVASETNGRGEAKARARWVMGHALAALLRPADALAAYDEAEAGYRRLGRRAEAARIAIGRVNALTWLGRYDHALQVGEKARRALGATRQAAAAARLDVNLGNLHHRVSDPRRALSCYDRALRTARKLGQDEMVATIQLNRATAMSALGKIGPAADLYRSVRDAAGAAGETRVRAFAEFNLGYIHFQCGEYGRAWDTLDAARQAFEELDDRHFLSLTLVDLAELLIETSSWRRAAATAGRAGELAASLGLRLEQGRAALMRAIAAIGAGDDPAAARALDEAETIFIEEGNPGLRALGEVYRARLEHRAGAFGAAAERAEAAATSFVGSKLRIQEVGARLTAAEARLGGGELDAADRQIAEAGRRLRGISSPWLRARRAHLRGRLEEARGRRSAATRAYRAAVRGLEDIRGRIGIDEFRVGFGDANAAVYADLIALTLEQGRDSAVEDAFALIERARSRSLVDLLSGRLSARGGEESRTSALLERLATLRGELNRASGFPTDRGDGLRRSVALSSRSVAAVEEEIADTLRRLERRSAGMGRLTSGETTTLEETAAALPADTELVEFFLGPRGCWAIVLGPAGARAIRLRMGAEEVRAKVGRLRFQIEKMTFGDDYARGREELLRVGVDRHFESLAAALWAPLGITARRVVIVPHGPLHLLPFAALPISPDERVVDRHVVSVFPSASCRRFVSPWPDRRMRERSILAVASHVDDLPGADREVERVRRFFPRGRMLRGRRATWASFRAASKDANVIHIATHGLFRPEDPSLSALLLADGWVRVADLLSLRLDADLVALSACQTGRVAVAGGDEMVGLCRGFLHAGARSLLVSLWPVDDRATGALMEAFYKDPQGGSDPAEALANAMRATRDEWPHVFHWAPFVAVSWPAGTTGKRRQASRG